MGRCEKSFNILNNLLTDAAINTYFYIVKQFYVVMPAHLDFLQFYFKITVRTTYKQFRTHKDR